MFVAVVVVMNLICLFKVCIFCSTTLVLPEFYSIKVAIILVLGNIIIIV